MTAQNPNPDKPRSSVGFPSSKASAKPTESLGKFRIHAVETRWGMKWRVVFPDGFAVRFLSWDKALNYVLIQIKYARATHPRWAAGRPRGSRSEQTRRS